MMNDVLNPKNQVGVIHDREMPLYAAITIPLNNNNVRFTIVKCGEL